MSIVHITLGVTPSLNELKNFWQYHKYKKLYLKQLKGYELILGLKNPQKRKIKIERYGSRTLDRDNFIGGCKSLIDSLRDCGKPMRKYGLIVDDRDAYLECEYEQIKCKRGEEKTRLTIWI